MKRPVRSRPWGCRLRFCVGLWAQRIRRLHGWKTPPPSTGKERADDPAPAPTLLTRCDVPGVQLLMGTHAVHCTVHGTLSTISFRCPGPNGTSHSTPGPRCQRRQLRPHNQKHPDLTIRLFSRKPPHSCAPTSSRAPRLSRQTPGAHAPGFVVAMGSVTAPAPPLQQSQGSAATIRWRCCSPPAQSDTARHHRSRASGFRRMLGTLR